MGNKECRYHFDLSPGDALQWITDFGWIITAVWMLAGAPALGATTVLLEGAPDHPDGDRVWRAIEDHDQSLEVVLTADALRTIESDPEMTRQANEVLAADGVSAFRYDGTIPYFLALADGRALVGVLDDSGGIRGLVVSAQPAVVTWATEALDEYCTAAEPIETVGR
jgi:hypothetical protein